MKKCTQCGQILSDDTKFCFKCGGANFEPAEEAGSAYQQPAQQSYYAQSAQQPTQSQQSYYSQPSYQQPAYQPPQPAYQPPVSSNETVSIGMYILFMILNAIPLVGLIFTIIVAASSGFKKSYRNLAKATLILMAIGIVIGVILAIAIPALFADFFDSFYYNYY